MKRLELLLILFAILISGCASVPTHEQMNIRQTTTITSNLATETPVRQGRSAVEFYNSKTVTNDDPLRLSNEFVQYPVKPVERLQPILELGDPFLGNGLIRPGIKTPTGQMIQPSFLLFGTFRSAFQSYENGDVSSSEWANRLDLHGNLKLSGTERVLISMRPLDRETGGYSGYNFSPKNNNGWKEEFNAALTQLFFEGDIGEIFPGLDPADSGTFDIGFSIGRQSILLQDGLLMNDIIDSVGVTRNSLVFDGISNLRITGLYGWNHINRGNNNLVNNSNDNSAQLFGLFTEADTAWDNTLALDVIYVDDKGDDNAWFVGVSSTQRFGMLNTTFRVNASIPEQGDTPLTKGGVLLLSELSSTLHGTDNSAYFNAFWNINKFTSAGRGRDQGNPVSKLGVLYSPVGMGRYGVPLGQDIADTFGAAVGYQMYLGGGIDSQLIMELGARTSTKSSKNEGVAGFGARFQQALGKHHILRLDSFFAAQEANGPAYGLRTEWVYKF